MNNIEEIATSFAREYGNDAIYPSHLFKAILHKDIGMVHFIETDLDKDYYYLQEWADVQMQLSPKTARPVRDPHYSQEAEAVMEEAENYQMKLGLATCEPACILASLATPGVGFSLDQLKTLPLTVSEIMAKVEGTAHRDGKEKGESSATRATTATDNGMIRKYCIDKRQEMESGNVPPVIGFENEISTIYEIFGRKLKSNLLITGESGIGKTSLINGFVSRLLSGNVPAFLSKSAVYELELSSLSADSAYKGEVEDRFKKLLAEIKELDNAILVIESIDNNSRRRTHRSVSRFGTRGSTWREHMGCPSGSSCRWLNAGRC